MWPRSSHVGENHLTGEQGTWIVSHAYSYNMYELTCEILNVKSGTSARTKQAQANLTVATLQTITCLQPKKLLYTPPAGIAAVTHA